MKKHVLVLALLAVLVTSAGISANEKVTVLLDWVPNTNHTGIYVALDKGWYEEEGLDLQIITPSDNMSVEQIVAVGRADFGISFQEWVTYARVQGVPLVSIAAVIQHNTSGFISLKDKNITRPKDFEGKTYGGWGMPIEEVILKAFVEGDGGDYERVRNINVGMADILTLLDRDIDFAWIFYGWQGVEAEVIRKMDLNIVKMEDYFHLVPDYYTPVIITSENMVAKRPETIRKFLAAVSRGYEFAVDNPLESAEILHKYIPESSKKLIVESQRWLSPRYIDDALQWGYQSYQTWRSFGVWMYENGLIDEKFDASSAFTNEFLPR